jgi:hypothetical protein
MQPMHRGAKLMDMLDAHSKVRPGILGEDLRANEVGYVYWLYVAHAPWCAGFHWDDQTAVLGMGWLREMLSGPLHAVRQKVKM